MANNFRLIGGRYISKEGDDLNNGETPNTPKATLSAFAGSSIYIVGSGYYPCTSLSSSTGGTFVADGLVKIRAITNVLAQPSDNIYATALNTESQQAHPIIFDLNGFSFLTTRRLQFYNVIFTNGFVSNASVALPHTIEKCVFEAGFTLANSGGLTINKTQFFNAVVTLLGATGPTIKNCYVDDNTSIEISALFANPATQFKHNCVNGSLIIAGTPYELKLDRNGVAIPSRVGNGIADLDDLYGNTGLVYTRDKNFAAEDVGFLNIEKRDYFSVSPTSPLVFGDDTGLGNIGNVNVSVVAKASDAVFADGTITGLTTSVGDFVLDGTTNGSVISLPIQIAPAPQVIKYMNFAELLNFNSDIAKGSPENNNVTIVDNFDSGTKGGNPRRLTYQMRWSNKDTIPTTDADWDNQNYTPAGTYSLFEQFTKPLIDTNGLGNGNPDFNSTGAVGIKAKWVQIIITIIEGIGPN